MNDVSRELMKKIDEEVEALTKGMEQVKIAQVAQPIIDKYANEAGLDPIDLFVDYMDHVALTSKRMATDGEDITFTEADLDNPGFKLY